MDDAEIERRLTARLTEAGAAGGRFGGSSVGFGGAWAGGRGGTAGGRLAARFLRTRVHQADRPLPLPPGAAAERLAAVFERLGTMIEGEIAPDGASALVVGEVGAGIGNLNPAIIQARLVPASVGSRALLRVSAKEGLVPQHTGEKAMRRVLDEFAASTS